VSGGDGANQFLFCLAFSFPLEQILHVVLSKRRHTRDAFPAPVGESVFDTAMAEGYAECEVSDLGPSAY
jgi:hypothetical protein